ncbi:MAG: outer membrane lipoprotein carrier protein LolA [Oligoflexia bacterium]|nr:outer membrane lipoprotein carrier protein LolA [Oligoflexia bacterium]
MAQKKDVKKDIEEQKLQKTFIPKSFKAQFEQSFSSSLNGKLRSGNGIFSYMYPGRIRLEILEPNSDRSTFVCNSKKSWYYNPPFDETEKGQVTIQSSDKLNIVKFFDTMSVGLKSNKRFDVKESKKQKETFIEIVFKGKTVNEIGVKSAKIFPKDYDKNEINLKNIQFNSIGGIELTYPDEKKVRLTFKNIEENVTFSEKDFEFIIPANTKIIER